MTIDTAPSARRAPVSLLAVLGVAAFVVLLVRIGSGTTFIAPGDVLREILHGDTGERINVIVWRIRLPEALTCVLVGAILGIVGSAFQALFRNPLADPYIVGVSSGSAVGGALALVLGIGVAWAGLGMMACAFVGGLLALIAVFHLSRRRGVVDVTALLLAGVVLGALLSAVLMLVLLASGRDTNQVLRWLMGSTSPAHWNRVAILAAALGGGGFALVRQTRALNAFAVEESSAQRLGVDTERLKRTVLLAGTAMTAVAVGSVGIIGFLGLVSPHIARRLTGVDWRWSMLASGLIGAALLASADIVARHATPDGIPVGIVTALLGAPFLIVLMRRA
ncbi:MAG: iron ABC transporter permease [Fimbriimonadaceae bacterium]|nr:iron ABC transporter permease [Fimbriimonadaceae bacterium]